MQPYRACAYPGDDCFHETKRESAYECGVHFVRHILGVLAPCLTACVFFFGMQSLRDIYDMEHIIGATVRGKPTADVAQEVWHLVTCVTAQALVLPCY